jgi:hypothetical protein
MQNILLTLIMREYYIEDNLMIYLHLPLFKLKFKEFVRNQLL